jgi:hypothetical protein
MYKDRSFFLSLNCEYLLILYKCTVHVLLAIGRCAMKEWRLGAQAKRADISTLRSNTNVNTFTMAEPPAWRTDLLGRWRIAGEEESPEQRQPDPPAFESATTCGQVELVQAVWWQFPTDRIVRAPRGALQRCNHRARKTIGPSLTNQPTQRALGVTVGRVDEHAGLVWKHVEAFPDRCTPPFSHNGKANE